MANELLTRDDIIRGKKNFDAQNLYMTGTADEKVTLPDGQKINTLKGDLRALREFFPEGSVGLQKVGSGPVDVVVNQDLFKFLNNGSLSSEGPSSKDFNEFEPGSRYYVAGLKSYLNAPNLNVKPSGLGYFIVETSILRRGACKQVAFSCNSLEHYERFRGDDSPWSRWASVLPTESSFTTTTATSANAVVTSTGELQRSTSSKIFKKDIANIAIDDYRAALKAVRPVSYRSTEATADRTDWSWYSFIAEELAELDPRLVQMSSVEFFEDTDEDGNPFINSRELPEGEYAANGINTNGLVALMAYISQQLLDDVEKLESEKTQLKRRMTGLEKRMDALDGQSAANPV